VADDIHAKRLSLIEAAKTMLIGNRAELGHCAERFRRGSRGLFPVREPGEDPKRIGGTDRERLETFELAASGVPRTLRRGEKGRKEECSEGDAGERQTHGGAEGIAGG
jgi:hypothetical protein